MSTPAPLNSEFAERISHAQSCMRTVALDGEAFVHVNVPRGDVYFDATIEGVRFQAVVADDPYVMRKETGEGCPLGVALIARARRINADGVPKDWMVCKYSASEGRIRLSMLTDAGRRAFAITFGVPLPDFPHELQGPYGFYASRSFDGLAAWAARHPRLFKAMAGRSSYVGNWKAVVSARLAELKPPAR